MVRLDNLSRLVKKRKRVGRGGSRGGTSGRGHKGQKARSGGSIALTFEGGQMPLVRRLPKRGFTNARFKKIFELINLEQIETVFDEGAVINKESLIEKGLIKSKKSKKGASFLIKVLGDGVLSKKVTIYADAFSKSALKAIQDCGGEANVTREI